MEKILMPTVSTCARSNIRKILLLSGFISAIIYVVADIVASLSYPGYSITDQNFSELLATGAPTRKGLLLISWVYNFLVACFGLAIWKMCQPAYKAHIAGAVIMGYAILSMITPLYFQMDMRGAEPTPNGSLHPLMTGFMSLFIIMSIGSGAFLSGQGFRIYSFVTIAAVTVFGILTVDQVPDLAAGLDTPWMGLKERVNIYLTMIWFAMLSLTLFQQEKEDEYYRKNNPKEGTFISFFYKNLTEV